MKIHLLLGKLSTANNLGLHKVALKRSLLQIRERRETRIDAWGTPIL